MARRLGIGLTGIIGAVVQDLPEPPPAAGAPVPVRDRHAAVGLALVGFVTLTVAFEFTKRWFPIPEIEVSRIAMVVAMAWFAWLLIGRRERPQLPPRTLIVVGGLVVALEWLSFALTRWPNAPKEVAAVSAYAAFAVVVASAVRTRRDLAILGACLLASGAIVGALGVAEQVFDFYLWKDRPLEVFGRRNSTFADPNITARFYLLSLAVGLGVLAAGPSRSRAVRALVLATLALVAAGLVLTGSRTGWILLLILLAAWLPVILRGRSRDLRLGAGVIVAVFVVTYAVNPAAGARWDDVPPTGELQPVRSGPLAARTDTIVDPILRIVPIDAVRQYLIRAGVAMFQDAPLAGVGLGGFQPQILGPYRGFIPADRLSRPTSLEHTELVRVAAETGVVGLAVLLSLFAAAWWTLWRSARGRGSRDRIVAYTLAVLLLLLGLSSQMEARFYTEPYLWLLLGAIAAFARLAARGPGGVVTPSVEPAT